MPVTAWLWLALILVAIIYELWTALDDLVDHERGSQTWPLTWVYRRLMCNRLIRTMVWSFFGWMIWHWGIQLFGPWEGNGWVDIMFVIAGGIFGFFATPKRKVRCGETEED